MKRILILLLVLVLLLAGCGQSGGSSTGSQEESATVQEPEEQLEDKEQDMLSPEEVEPDVYLVPDMTPEQQVYSERYIQPLLTSGMLMVDWSTEDYQYISTAPHGQGLSINLMFAFEDLVGQGRMQELWAEHGADLPGDEVERMLLERFPFTTEQIREILDRIYYADRHVYDYGGGRGGGPIEGFVVGIEEAGEDQLRLHYQLYTGYRDEGVYENLTAGILTVEERGDTGRYIAVEILEGGLARDVALRDEDTGFIIYEMYLRPILYSGGTLTTWDDASALTADSLVMMYGYMQVFNLELTEEELEWEDEVPYYYVDGPLLEEYVTRFFELEESHLRGSQWYVADRSQYVFNMSGVGWSYAPSILEADLNEEAGILTLSLDSGYDEGDEIVSVLRIQLTEDGGWRYLSCQHNG